MTSALTSDMQWYQWTETDIACISTSLQSSSISQPFDSDISTNSSPGLRALAYGDGFFTTIAVHQSQVLWQRYHDARLHSHAAALDLNLSLEQRHLLWRAVGTYAQDIKYGIIKIIVGRQTQRLRGYAYSSQLSDNGCDIWIGILPSQPLATQTSTLLAYTNKTSVMNAQYYASSQKTCDVLLQQPPIVAVCLASQLASLPPKLAGLKTLNRLDSVLAAGELEAYKLDNTSIGEGLIQDMSGQWVAGVMSNVFYQLQSDFEVDVICELPPRLNQWYTPPINASGIRGTMREALIDKSLGTTAPIRKRALLDSDLSNLKAMFFCNAVRGIIPVNVLINGSDSIIMTPL